MISTPYDCLNEFNNIYMVVIVNTLYKYFEISYTFLQYHEPDLFTIFKVCLCLNQFNVGVIEIVIVGP